MGGGAVLPSMIYSQDSYFVEQVEVPRGGGGSRAQVGANEYEADSDLDDAIAMDAIEANLGGGLRSR